MQILFCKVYILWEGSELLYPFDNLVPRVFSVFKSNVAWTSDMYSSSSILKQLEKWFVFQYP